MQSTLFTLALLFSSVLAAAPAKQACADGAGPRGAVMGYLTAMHEHRFEDAYDFVSSSMTDGRTRADWSALQERAYRPGKVEIYGVDARRAMAAEDDLDCTTQAVVPNILSSRDKFNEHGSVEFEIYFVKRDGDVWQVDSQETLFDDDGIAIWFPEVKLFKARDPE